MIAREEPTGEIARLLQRISFLEGVAYIDPLTGMFNRRRYEERRQEYSASRIWLAIDVDKLKFVNDKFGHASGDEYLRTVAQILQSCVRESDSVHRIAGSSSVAELFRYGGDEFFGFLECAPEDAKKVVDRIRKSIANAVIKADRHRGFKPSVSIGVGFTPEMADANLYKEKKKKKGGFVFKRDERLGKLQLVRL